jgi:hypothetical protein
MRLTNKARKQGYNAYTHQKMLFKVLAAEYMMNYEEKIKIL